jgi:hypothetical protein
MIQLILFLALGALLFVSLLILARRGSRPEGAAEALVGARQALNHLQSGLLPAELVERIFAADDFEFVASAAPRSVQVLFWRERKKIALAWIAQLRRQIRNLRRFHLGAARFYSRLGIRSEMALALDFMILLIICRTLQLLVYLGGPRVAPRMIGTTATAASRICEVSEKSLAFLSVPDSLAGRTAAP